MWGAFYQRQWDLWNGTWYFPRQRNVGLAAHTRASCLICCYTDELPAERCKLYIKLYNEAFPGTAYELTLRIQDFRTQAPWASIYVAASVGSR